MIHEFCKGLSICPRGHSVFHDGEWFNVYCFAEAGDAGRFLQKFGGERFDPKQRGKGSDWARWKKVLIPVQAAHHNEMMSPAVTE